MTGLPSKVAAPPEPEEPAAAYVGVDLLTTRQAEIVRLIACGLTYAEVSERLHVGGGARVTVTEGDAIWRGPQVGRTGPGRLPGSF